MLWKLFLGHSSLMDLRVMGGAGISIVLISPRGKKYKFSLPIVATSTNNQAEYQALIKGLELLKEVHTNAVEIFGDSMLVINQLAGVYEC